MTEMEITAKGSERMGGAASSKDNFYGRAVCNGLKIPPREDGRDERI
jgi:hypothetical protein